MNCRSSYRAARKLRQRDAALLHHWLRDNTACIRSPPTFVQYGVDLLAQDVVPVCLGLLRREARSGDREGGGEEVQEGIENGAHKWVRK